MANPNLSVVNGSKISAIKRTRKHVTKTIDNLNVDQHLLLELSNKLHCTLELDNLINVFKQELMPIFDLDDVLFHEAHRNQQFDPKGRHMLSYQLILHKNDLGEIAIMRRSRFTVKEQKLIEKFLVTLLSPLNNALRYQDALKAALLDPLTGAFNRSAMDGAFSREMELAQRNKTPLSLIALDIDFFKQVNDQYGHATGDCVLKHLIECVNQCTRNTDMVFRFGGEEFLILLNNTNREGTENLAERIRKTVETTPCICNGQSVTITVSIGISTYNNNDTRDSFFERADKALYEAKNSGRNQVISGH